MAFFDVSRYFSTKTWLASACVLFSLLTVSSHGHTQQRDVSIGTVVGNTPADFDVTYGGAASYKVPLALPTGAAGLKPSITLTYNSQFGNGLMGLGWELFSGVARIEECYKRNTNQRIYCLNGEELVSVDNGYYRTEIDSNILVEKVNSATFTLHYENGDRKTLTRHLSSPDVYLETEHRQRGGAYYTSTWSVDNTQREPLLSQIDYQGNQIDFIYEARSDKRAGYWMGAPRNRTQRLQSIVAKSDGQVYRQYDVFYQYDSVSQFSKVSHIQECTANDGCLKPLSFDWSDSGTAGFYDPVLERGQVYALANLNNDGILDKVDSGLNSRDRRTRVYFDNNGDGVDDLITINPYSLDDGNDVDELRVIAQLSNDVGSVSPHVADLGGKVLNADLNGDGKQEIVMFTHTYAYYYHHEGDWAQNPRAGRAQKYPLLSGDTRIPSYLRTACYPHVHLADLDGNGLPDIIFNSSERLDYDGNADGCSSAGQVIYFNEGDFQFSPHFSGKEPGINARGLQYVDINGDGLSDPVYQLQNTKGLYYRLSTGNGSFTEERWFIDSIYGHYRFADLNADGRLDFLQIYENYSVRVKYNVGIGGFGPSVSIGSISSRPVAYSIGQDQYHIGDVTGDGITDFILPYESSLKIPSGRHDILKGSSKQSYIKAFTDSLGNQHQVDYSKLTDKSVYTRDPYGANVDFGDARPYQSSQTVVQSIKTPDHEVYYHYAGARMHVGRYGYLGFQSITSVLEKEDDTGAPHSLVTTSYLNQQYPFIGKLRSVKKKVYSGAASDVVGQISYQHDDKGHLIAFLNGTPIGAQTISDLAGDLQSRGGGAIGTDFTGQMSSYFDWQSLTLTGGVHKVYLAETVVDYLQLSDDALTKTERTQATLAKSSSGRYARLVSSRASVYDQQGVLIEHQQTNTTYQSQGSYGTGDDFLVKASQVTTKRYDNGKLTDTHQVDTENDYLANGLLQRQWLNRADEKGIVTHYAYDQYGNSTSLRIAAVSASQGLASRTTQMTYSHQGKYLRSSSNSAGHQSTYNDFNEQGLPQQVTDSRGLASYHQYDGLGRLVSTTDHLGNIHRTLRGFCLAGSNAYGCTNGAYTWEKTEPAGSAHSVTYWSQKGHPVKTATQGLVADEWLVQVMEYDGYSRATKESVPQLTSLFSTITFTAGNHTTQRYDELNRVVRKQLPGNNRVVLKSYRDEQAIVTTDPAGRITLTETNSLGQIIRKQQPDNTEVLFRYDAQGNVIEQRYNKLDTQGNPITGQYHRVISEYDRYGNRTSLTDPSAGDWTYLTNAFGETIQQTDGKGQVTYFTYDTLGRLITQRDNDTYSIWSYDQGVLGQLDRVSQYFIRDIGASAKANLTPETVSNTRAPLVYQQDTDYDPVTKQPGRVDTQQRNRRGHLLASIATSQYDRFGRLSQSQLPALYQRQGSLTAPVLAYHYSDTGYLQTLKDRDSSTVYQQVNAIDAFGNITQQTLGGGAVALQRRYDNHTGWATSLQVSNGTGLVIDQYYSDYNALGHIGQRDDITYYNWGADSQIWSESFEYNDGLKQQLTQVTISYDQDLSGALLSEDWSHNYQYDALGNIRSQSVTSNSQLVTFGRIDYHYSSQNPHQLVRTTGAVAHHYQYDGNGSVTRDGQKTLSYYSWNKVKQIHKGNSYTSFEYGPDRSRYLRVDVTPTKTTETLYGSGLSGDAYERVSTTENSQTTVEHRYTIGGIALITQTEKANTEDVRYQLTDYQESLLGITHANGELLQRFRYTPYGSQIDVTKGARTPVGRSGQQNNFPNPNAPKPRNAPETINGRDYSGHAIDRMQERGYTPSVIENALQNGARTAGNKPNTSLYSDTVNKLRVVTNSETGNVITVIPGLK